MTHYPQISRQVPTSMYTGSSPIFLDLEFTDHRPTILGISQDAHAFSVPWNDGKAYLGALLAKRPDLPIVGHSILTADRPVMEKALGIKLPPERFQDTMIWHYLCNAELCKGVMKANEEEEDDGGKKDTRGEGFMDLWTFASLYTSLSNWKWNWDCASPSRCGNRPCPRHHPHWYNGLDSLSLDLAWVPLQADAASKHIPHELYSHVASLTLLCARMSQRGIHTDRAKIKELKELIDREKDKLFPYHTERKIGKKGQILKGTQVVWDAPFNPRSPKQIMAWFADRDVVLSSTDREDIALALDRTEDGTEEHKWLSALFDSKMVGKGINPWVGDGEIADPEQWESEYIDKHGDLHPRFIPTASSLGRLASSGPNFQNIPSKGRIMARLREAIIPRPGHKLVTSDAKQLELRMCMWYACGRTDLGPDAFTWLVAQAPDLFAEATRNINRPKWTARDTAKSVTHGGDYLEGAALYTGRQLESGRTKAMIERGALKPCWDWEYCGKIVCFTGANLAHRLFKSKSWENRAKANQIQEAIYGRFHELRAWQKRVSQEIQDSQAVRCPYTGRFLDLSCYTDPVDRLKIALARHGQGGGADYIQEGMLHYKDDSVLPLFQVHDELGWERPLEESDNWIKNELAQCMAEESKRMPGFSCPVDVHIGPNWAACKG